jgi:hypothetical protein
LIGSICHGAGAAETVSAPVSAARRLSTIGAVTTVWDTAHSVIAALGDRFVTPRLDSTTGRQAAYRRTMANTGDEVTMRAELAEAVGSAVAAVDGTANLTLTEVEIELVGKAADLVTLARTGVEYDYKGDVIGAHAPGDAHTVRPATPTDRARRCRPRHEPSEGDRPRHPRRAGLHAAGPTRHHRRRSR